MINLFTTFYHEEDLFRSRELLDCLMLNVECNVIDRIYVLVENMKEIPLKASKLVLLPVNSRPTYNDFFKEINSRTADNDINIIANTDLFFKDDLNIIKQLNLKNTCLALTRWDISQSSDPEFLGRVDSQDAWIFKGKIQGVAGDFYLGSLGCDNKIAYEIKQAGYKLLNPSLTVKSYHLHLSQHRPGLSAYTSAPLPGPYLYIPISTHHGKLKNWAWKINRGQVNQKSNNFLMHRLYESWLKDMISQKNRDLKKQVALLIKCFYYRPALNRKYLRHYFSKLVKPVIRSWIR